MINSQFNIFSASFFLIKLFISTNCRWHFKNSSNLLLIFIITWSTSYQFFFSSNKWIKNTVDTKQVKHYLYWPFRRKPCKCQIYNRTQVNKKLIIWKWEENIQCINNTYPSSWYRITGKSFFEIKKSQFDFPWGGIVVLYCKHVSLW